MTPKEITDVVLEFIELGAPPSPVELTVVQILVARGHFPTTADAHAAFDAARTTVLARIRRHWNQHSSRGQPLNFALLDTPNDDFLIHGTCYIFPTDGPEVVNAKTRRAFSTQIAAVLASIADPFDFERLCKKVLSLLGVADPSVTRAARDEGVDFFGKLNPVAERYIFDVTPTVQKSLDIWLVGQAKHYPAGQAGTPDLRHLFGSVSLARAGAYSTNSFTSRELTLRVADPVFYLFFTTGKLSTDAWTLVQKTGIVAMDGGMLSAFLADRGLGDTIKDSKAFATWLTSP